MRSNRYTRITRRKGRHGKRGLTQAIIVILLCTPFLVALLGLAVFTVGARTAVAISAGAPKLEDQKPVVLAETSRIYAADGTLLTYLYGIENRTVIGSERIPQVVKDSVVAIEDERFYQHRGVDFQGVLRALARDFEAGRVIEGASTITQQLVGNLYLDRRDTSINRKFQEMVLAWQLETKMSKDEILDQYLNTVYFGSNAYGVQAAARTYFDKDPKDLTLPQAALLAGLPQAPTAYSPRQHPDAARERRNVVLARMYSNGFIGYDQYSKAATSSLTLAPSSPYTKVQEPYIVAYVRKQLIDMFGEDEVFKGGLTVETTIEPKYQQWASEAIADTLNEKGDPSGSLVAIETRTGHIKAMVGGSDYDSSKFNLAVQGRRQPGSSFKTFVLAAAVEKGIDPYSTYYESMPLSLHLPGSREPWNVATYGHNYYGSSSVVQATLRSDNTVYAQMALDVTPERIVDIAHRMGVTSHLDPNPAMALGGLKYGVSPLEMASAYGTLANEGKQVKPTAILRVKNSSGKVIWEAKPKETQAISAGVAYVVSHILEMNVQGGTGTRAQLSVPVAGKTGTAQNYQDAWFCGFTRSLSTSVWVGHPEAQIEMRDVHGIRVTGGTFPAEIWAKFMRNAIADYKAEEFLRPAITVKYNYNFVSKYAVEPTTSSSRTSTSGTRTSLAPPLTNPGTHPPVTQPSGPPPTTTPTAPVPPT